MVADQVRIQLATRDIALELPEKPGPILVTTNLGRYELSRLVNSLLDAASPIPLDFLVNGTFLRTSIDAFLTAHAISAETLLNLEYIRAQLPPTPQASFEHDDWVGSVDVLSESAPAVVWSNGTHVVPKGQERLLSGSFDGLLRVWDMSGRVLATSTTSQEEPQGKRMQHIMATKFVSPNLIATASGSRSQLWRYSENESNSAMAGSIGASLDHVLDCLGHTSSINSLAVHGPSQRYLTASDDLTARLWSSDITASAGLPPVPANLTAPIAKRRKVSSAAAKTSFCGSLLTLTGHTAPVTSTIFHPSDPTAAYTISRDGALRTWDLETARCVSTRTPDKPFTRLTALCALPDLSLLAVGTCYSNTVLVDPREAAATEGVGQRTAVLTLKGHRNEVSALATSPQSKFGLVSGSFDGMCRVWDVRNTGASVTEVDSSGDANGGNGEIGRGKVARSSFKLPRRGNARCDEVVGGKGVKVFDVVWNSELGIVSASEDKAVQVDR